MGKDDPLWRARRLLIAAHESRSEVRLAWNAKVTLRSLCDIDCSQLAGAYLGEFSEDLTDADCPPEFVAWAARSAAHTPSP